MGLSIRSCFKGGTGHLEGESMPQFTVNHDMYTRNKKSIFECAMCSHFPTVAQKGQTHTDSKAQYNFKKHITNWKTQIEKHIPNSHNTSRFKKHIKNLEQNVPNHVQFWFCNVFWNLCFWICKAFLNLSFWIRNVFLIVLCHGVFEPGHIDAQGKYIHTLGAVSLWKSIIKKIKSLWRIYWCWKKNQAPWEMFHITKTKFLVWNLQATSNH